MVSQSGVEFSFLCVREIVLCEYSDGEKEIKNNVLCFRKTKYQNGWRGYMMRRSLLGLG